jgi:hypothetical protein
MEPALAELWRSMATFAPMVYIFNAVVGTSIKALSYAERYESWVSASPDLQSYYSLNLT